MRNTKIAIIGGGVSGLYAAWLLQQHGVADWVLIEGRDTLGGRILSVPASAKAASANTTPASTTDRFDLGPSWFWPGYQRQLDHLIQELGLDRFEQHEMGDMVVERAPHEPPMRMRGYVNSPPSVRLVGGMASLTEALQHRLDATRILTGETVRHLRIADDQVELDIANRADQTTTWQAEHVLLALPPRMALHHIDFSPALPPSLTQQWQTTDTWMAPHAKYVAVYEAPFWLEQGLSGEGRSARGPLVEIHDASMPGGSAALFGFIGVPARVRQTVPEATLRSHCRAQLARMFGPQAATPKAEFIKDWAQEPYTATEADWDGSGQHPVPPSAGADSGPWRGRLTAIGSEWSPQFPGYIAGAIEAASIGVASLIKR